MDVTELKKLCDQAINARCSTLTELEKVNKCNFNLPQRDILKIPHYLAEYIDVEDLVDVEIGPHTIQMPRYVRDNQCYYTVFYYCNGNFLDFCFLDKSKLILCILRDFPNSINHLIEISDCFVDCKNIDNLDPSQSV